MEMKTYYNPAKKASTNDYFIVLSHIFGLEVCWTVCQSIKMNKKTNVNNLCQ